MSNKILFLLHVLLRKISIVHLSDFNIILIIECLLSKIYCSKIVTPDVFLSNNKSDVNICESNSILSVSALEIWLRHEKINNSFLKNLDVIILLIKYTSF